MLHNKLHDNRKSENNRLVELKKVTAPDGIHFTAVGYKARLAYRHCAMHRKRRKNMAPFSGEASGASEAHTHLVTLVLTHLIFCWTPPLSLFNYVGRRLGDLSPQLLSPCPPTSHPSNSDHAALDWLAGSRFNLAIALLCVSLVEALGPLGQWTRCLHS